MKLGIIGHGFVGKTVSDFLENHGVSLILVDPKYFDNTLEEARESCDAFIICVPTPEGVKGECDDSIVKKCIEILGPSKPILLKSTVTFDKIKNYSQNVTYNPEFLRAAHAKEDFENQEVFILGNTDLKQIKFWKEIFTSYLSHARIFCTDRLTASMIKYVHNAWLATKVVWFHELFANLPKDINYNELRSILSTMENIGPSHMVAPNDKGGLGYGGYCFPKDVQALTSVIKHSVLEQVKITNEQLKKSNF